MSINTLDPDWASAWAAKNGSAIDVWMPRWQQDELQTLLKSGLKVKSVMLEIDSADKDEARIRIDRETARMRRHGYALFAAEDNIDSYELVFIK